MVRGMRAVFYAPDLSGGDFIRDSALHSVEMRAAGSVPWLARNTCLGRCTQGRGFDDVAQ